jgi:hypothetical protein
LFLNIETMKRYTEVRNYDDMGNVLDGTRESPTGEYIMVDDLLAWLKDRRDGWSGAKPRLMHPQEVVASLQGELSVMIAHIEG